MRKLFTIDTSVFAASLLEKEARHLEAKRIVESIIKSDGIIIIPYTVLIELVSVIIRRTRSIELALKAEDLLLKNLQIHFISLDRETTMRILALSKEVSLRSLDLILYFTSKEFNSELITFDKEILNKVSKI